MAREIKHTITENTLTITGEGQEPIVVNATDVHESIRPLVFMHGLKQKIGDEAALGKDSTLADKFAGMRDMVSRLIAGTWREASKSGGSRAGQTVLSLVELFAATPKLARILGKKAGSEPASLDAKGVQTWYATLPEDLRDFIADTKEVKVTTAQRKLREAEGSGKSLSD